MTIATEKKIWTDEEFMALPDDGDRYEIVNGELVNMGNSGMEHGNLGTFLGGALELYVRPRKLGVACDSSTAFKMKSGNKRSPDISFVAKERLKGLKLLTCINATLPELLHKKLFQRRTRQVDADELCLHQVQRRHKVLKVALQMPLPQIVLKL